jgi:hypothetical protein
MEFKVAAVALDVRRRQPRAFALVGGESHAPRVAVLPQDVRPR